MYIQKKIHSALQQAKLYDNEGNLVETKKLMQEFENIKNYIALHFEKVAIHLEQNYLYLLVMLACMELKITYIPLRKGWPQNRINQILSISKAKIFGENELLSAINFKTKVDINKKKTDDILYIIFTSGTTGAPKGVMIKRSSYENFLMWLDEYFDITNQDKMLLTTDFTFDISLVDIGLFLTKNIHLYFSNFNGNILKLMYELEKFNITIHSTVPYNYTMMINSHMIDRLNLSLKHIIIAGARFPYNLYKNLSLLKGAFIYNAYGPTEATIYATCHKLRFNAQDEVNHNISIGKPIRNTKLKILNNELLISGAGLMRGYLNDEQKSKKALIDIDNQTYYKTGDIAFVDDEGKYYITGRIDDTVKVAGFRVNLLDIDAYIHKLPYVKDCATVVMEDKKKDDNYLVSFMILKEQKTQKEIKNDLKEILTNYQIPKKIKFLEAFPLNNSGKIDKNKLKELV